MKVCGHCPADGELRACQEGRSHLSLRGLRQQLQLREEWSLPTTLW